MQLTVPNRTAPKKGSFDTKAASVKNWISRLPMADVGNTTRLLFEALTEFNQQDIHAAQRFQALEMLHKPVNYVSENMKRHFVGRSLPLADKNRKIARLSREITHTLATGYKVLVMEQIAGVGRKDKKLLVTSIHRAITLLSQVLLKTYQGYEAYPKSVWLEIHSLYRYAEEHDLHKTKVAADHNSDSSSSTIADVYKRILLLALACPYRLRHGDVESVYKSLAKWAPLAELQHVGQNGTSLFATNLESDQPPTYLVLRAKNANYKSCRALNTRKLAGRLQEMLSRSMDSKSDSQLSTRTLRHLMLAWGVMPKRRFSRVKDHSQVIVATGLSSIHYFVSGEVVFNGATVPEDCYSELTSDKDGPRMQDRARFLARTLREQEGQLPDVWEMNYRIEGDPDPSNLELAVARAASGMNIDTSHRTQNWKMVNVSAGGYCFLWDNPETTRAQVGELLGIREESDPDTFHWRLGIIRWLKFDEKRGLELGIQMLSPGAVAIAARRDRKSNGEHEYTRGLLLPEIASIQQQATMLMPSPPFKAGDSVIVNCQGKNVRVELTKLVENTGSFAQFQFCSKGEVDPPKPPRKIAQTKPKDFDDVWELL